MNRPTPISVFSDQRRTKSRNPPLGPARHAAPSRRLEFPKCFFSATRRRERGHFEAAPFDKVPVSAQLPHVFAALTLPRHPLTPCEAWHAFDPSSSSPASRTGRMATVFVRIAFG